MQKEHLKTLVFSCNIKKSGCLENKLQKSRKFVIKYKCKYEFSVKIGFLSYRVTLLIKLQSQFAWKLCLAKFTHDIIKRKCFFYHSKRPQIFHFNFGFSIL